MATVSYETGLPDVPKQKREPNEWGEKVWKCKNCGRMDKHSMEKGTSANVACKGCATENYIILPRARPMAPKKRKYNANMIEKAWTCAYCGRMDTEMIEPHVSTDIVCSRCDRITTIVYPPSRLSSKPIAAPTKMYPKVWSCEQCGRTHERLMQNMSSKDISCAECGHINTVKFERPTKAPIAAPKQAVKKWSCNECDAEYEHIMPLGSIETVECEDCGTKRKLTMPHKMPRKNILGEPHPTLKKINKAWKCMDCGTRQTTDIRIGEVLEIQCNSCGTPNQVSLPSGIVTVTKRIFGDPNKQRDIGAKLQHLTCEECGYKHVYPWGRQPKRCAGCGAGLARPKAPPYYNRPMSFSERNGLPRKKKKVYTGKAGNCESIW